mgnify:CR=1 FL=1
MANTPNYSEELLHTMQRLLKEFEQGKFEHILSGRNLPKSETYGVDAINEYYLKKTQDLIAAWQIKFE